MASIEPGPGHRPEERTTLLQWIEEGGLIHLHAPEGRGKTSLLRETLLRHPGPRLHLALPPLDEADLLAHVEHDAGPVERPERPDLLPLPGLGARWSRLLEGILLRLAAEAEAAPGVLVLDDFDHLLRARRRIAGELAEVLARIERRGLPVRILLATRMAELPEALVGEIRTLALLPLPFRQAGWGHGATDPMDAFRRWAIFGDHPAHLPKRRPSTSLTEAILKRVLLPEGDLFDAPLRRLGATFHAPSRYASILRGVAEEDRDWASLAQAVGVDRGSALAPYIGRLEEEGLLAVRLPMDAPEGARRRRYAPADPFLSFWFGLVLPNRGRLLRESATRVLREQIEPGLQAHFDRWLPEAARRWLAHHADEELAAPARVAGALWGGEGPEFEVAGRLTNGQVCYGIVQEGAGPAGSDLMTRVLQRMERTRFGLGRQARGPLVVLQGEADPTLRREFARVPLARAITPEVLMGTRPPRFG
jgi:hypothetical protein